MHGRTPTFPAKEAVACPRDTWHSRVILFTEIELTHPYQSETFEPVFKPTRVDVSVIPAMPFIEQTAEIDPSLATLHAPEDADTAN